MFDDGENLLGFPNELHAYQALIAEEPRQSE